jgi:hypothetical protein
MIPGRIPGATRFLGAPADWDESRDGICSTLPILDVPGLGGTNLMYSAWQPTPEELAALNAGSSVLLRVIGTGHPPVWVGVAQPPTEEAGT